MTALSRRSNASSDGVTAWEMREIGRSIFCGLTPHGPAQRFRTSSPFKVSVTLLEI